MVDVAQLVEPRIVIPVVVGSSPIIHPIISKALCALHQYGPLAQLVEQLTLNQLVRSSSLRRPTIFLPLHRGIFLYVEQSAWHIS
jgi:hypothetical protein